MKRPKLTIIVPTYNEHGTVIEMLERVKALPVCKEAIVVDNCSTDGTRELLVELRDGVRDDALRIVFQPENLLKGTSVKTGIALASGEWLVCQDADLEYDPNDILRLLDYAEKNGAAAVFGSRLSGPDQVRSSGVFHLARVFLSWLFDVLYRSQITDVATCYKLMRTDVAKSLNLEATGFDLDFEIAAKLRRCGHEIHELPVSYAPRTHQEGKKLHVGDGFKAVWMLLKCRLR